ncbi:MAG: lysophospholipid acyltransferase family protein, partial [Bacteroidota bacterium]
LKKHIQSGISLLIFAEGTQNRTKQPLTPFYDGAFRLAQETQTPLMPMVVINAGKLMPPSSINIRPGKIKVIFGEPVAVNENSVVSELKQTTYDQMLKLLQEN